MKKVINIITEEELDRMYWWWQNYKNTRKHLESEIDSIAKKLVDAKSKEERAHEDYVSALMRNDEAKRREKENDKAREETVE